MIDQCDEFSFGKMSGDSIEECIFMVQMCEQSEKYKDTIAFMKPVIQQKGSTLTPDERNLFSLAAKQYISYPRQAIRTIAAIEQNQKYAKFADALAAYKRSIEDEHHSNCTDIINLIKNDILSKPCDDAARAFYLKMAGDYSRYIAESAKDQRLADTKTQALQYYQEASQISEKILQLSKCIHFYKSLHPCSSHRLGLALNFSVFHYEVMQDVKKACELGEKALQDALDKLDDCDEDTFRDAQSIIELLRENLALWKEEVEGGDQQ